MQFSRRKHLRSPHNLSSNLRVSHSGPLQAPYNESNSINAAYLQDDSTATWNYLSDLYREMIIVRNIYIGDRRRVYIRTIAWETFTNVYKNELHIRTRARSQPP